MTDVTTSDIYGVCRKQLFVILAEAKRHARKANEPMYILRSDGGPGGKPPRGYCYVNGYDLPYYLGYGMDAAVANHNPIYKKLSQVFPDGYVSSFRYHA